MRDIVELSPETAVDIQGECAPGETVKLTMTCEVTRNDEGGFAATPTGDIDVEPMGDMEGEMPPEGEMPAKGGGGMPMEMMKAAVGKGKKS